MFETLFNPEPTHKLPLPNEIFTDHYKISTNHNNKNAKMSGKILSGKIIKRRAKVKSIQPKHFAEAIEDAVNNVAHEQCYPIDPLIIELSKGLPGKHEKKFR